MSCSGSLHTPMTPSNSPNRTRPTIQCGTAWSTIPVIAHQAIPTFPGYATMVLAATADHAMYNGGSGPSPPCISCSSRAALCFCLWRAQDEQQQTRPIIRRGRCIPFCARCPRLADAVMRNKRQFFAFQLQADNGSIEHLLLLQAQLLGHVWSRHYILFGMKIHHNFCLVRLAACCVYE